MQSVLDDVTNDSVDAKHIQNRVDDWEKRVSDLYRRIENWLPEGWNARNGKPVVMHEPLMEQFDIDARWIPTLELTSETGDCAKLEPRGLWIIGTNGRVDLKFAGKHYIIIDYANYIEQTNWRVTDATDRVNRDRLTHDWLKQALP